MGLLGIYFGEEIMFDFKDKIVVVTGGTKGIGLEIVRKFAEAGAAVFVGSRHESEELKKLKGEIFFQKTDVRFLNDLRKLVSIACENSGYLDVFINNAAIYAFPPIDRIDEEYVDQVIRTNLIGCIWGCKAASEKLKEGGVIINISSVAGKQGGKNNSVYCASKFGVVGLTQALAKELGERKIRVNGVCPGYIKTDELLKHSDELFKRLFGENPEIKNITHENFMDIWASKNTSLKRLTLAEEIANVCLFLASPLSSAITGQNINVDCGSFLQ